MINNHTFSDNNEFTYKGFIIFMCIWMTISSILILGPMYFAFNNPIFLAMDPEDRTYYRGLLLISLAVTASLTLLMLAESDFKWVLYL